MNLIILIWIWFLRNHWKRAPFLIWSWDTSHMHCPSNYLCHMEWLGCIVTDLVSFCSSSSVALYSNMSFCFFWHGSHVTSKAAFTQNKKCQVTSLQKDTCKYAHIFTFNKLSDQAEANFTWSGYRSNFSSETPSNFYECTPSVHGFRERLHSDLERNSRQWTVSWMILKDCWSRGVLVVLNLWTEFVISPACLRLFYWE